MSSRDRTVLILLLLIGGVLQLGDAGEARAACDVIPSASTQFAGARGTLGTPFAGPGDWVDVRVAPLCEGAGGGLTGAVGDYAVAIVFTPPAGPRTLRVLAESCAAFAASIPACETEALAPGGACCKQVATSNTPGVVPRLDLSGDAKGEPRLRFAFPDTDDSLGTVDDDVTLAGPAIIAVLRNDAGAPAAAAALHAPGHTCNSASGTVACIDELFEPDGSCVPAGRDRTFGGFTALPPSNSYASLCTSENVCRATATELRFTVDADGNVLAPIDWEDILRSQRGVPVPMQLHFSTPVRAFENQTTRVRIPNRTFVGSYDVKGRKLAPVFDPQVHAATNQDLTLFGTADAPRSVVRIARRACGTDSTAAVCRSDADCVAPTTCVPLFDFAGRLEDDAGPVVLTRRGRLGASFEAEARDPVPLEGLTQTEKLNAFTVSEPLALESLNGDPDDEDLVIKLSERESGARTRIGRGGSPGRAVLNVLEGAFGAPVARTFRAPAVAAEGNLVAFLESEAGQWHPNRSDANNDPNRNGRVVDGLLRVYRVGGGRALDVFADERAADGAPRINERSLVVSAGRVFYRRSEAGEARRITERVSLGPTGQELQSGAFRPALSTDGRFVGFHTTDRLFGTVPDTRIDYFRRDLAKHPDDPGFVELVSADTDGNEGGGLALPRAWSSDGNQVVFARTLAVSSEEGVFWRDMTRGRTRRVSNGTRGAISADGTTACFTAGGTPPGIVDLETGSVTTYPLWSDLAASTCAVANAGAVSAFNLYPNNQFTFFITGIEVVAGSSRRLIEGAFHVDPSLAADGRFLAFSSWWPELVDGDTNDAFDAFVLDRKNSTIERVSVNAQGQQANGLSTSPDMSADGRWISFVSEATNLVPRDANGTLDVFVHDRITGVTERVSVSTAGAETTSPETRDQVNDLGMTAVARDGIVAFERTSDTLVAGDGNGVTDVFVRRPDPTDLAHDFFPDGVLDDVVLEVFDGTSVTRLCPAEDVAVGSGRAAFLRPESELGTTDCPEGSLNDDHDTDDLVAQLWRGPGTKVENLGRAATAVALSDEFVAALVSEAGERNRDLNDDGAANDRVVELYSPSAGRWLGRQPFPAAEEMRFCGDDAVAFVTPEETDLNGDGDTDDRVLGLVTAQGESLGPAFHLGQAVEDFVCSGSLLALRTRERAQGQDLNGDRDASDDVLQVFDLARDECRRGLAPGCLRNTGKTIVPCNRPGCDPRIPYRVLEHTVRFLTAESNEGHDLNGDGDTDDVVLQVFNAATAPVTVGSSSLEAVALQAAPNVLAAAPVGTCTNTGEACVKPGDCGIGLCLVPPGECVHFDVACERRHPDCSSGYTCSPPRDAPTAECPENPNEPCPGICREIGGPCGVDADCPRGECLVRDVIARSLVSPLTDDPLGSVVVVSSGRCSEDLKEPCVCAGADCSCSAGGFCEQGSCVQFHGTCRTADDCPPTATCKLELVSAGTVDSDGDELPDPIDNCPHVANPDQADTDRDGFGDACGGCSGEECSGCPAEPDDCSAAPTASLAIRGGAKRKLTWQWRGPTVQAGDFAIATHHVCVYRRNAGQWTLRARLSIAADGTCNGRPCWQETGRNGLRYRNPSGGMSGVTELAFKRSANGLAITLNGKGPELELPSLPIGADEVGVELRRGDGVCWSSTFTTSDVNDARDYRASTP